MGVAVVNEEEYDDDDDGDNNDDDDDDDETGLTLTAATKRPMYVVSTTASLRSMSSQSVCRRARWHGGGPFARAQHTIVSVRGRARLP